MGLLEIVRDGERADGQRRRPLFRATTATATDAPAFMLETLAYARTAVVNMRAALFSSLSASIGQERMKELLTRIAETRDEAAFRELFEAYRPRLRSFMMRSGAPPETADELVQEAMLSVWRKAALYRPDKGTVAAWIFAIARNLRIDRLRREFDWQELPDEVVQALPADTPAPDEEMSSRQRQNRVRSVLGELGPEQREIVTLAYIEGLSHTEIAEKLNLPLGTVKSRMRLAYQKVRASLEDLR